jgi:hypothetical protein
MWYRSAARTTAAWLIAVRRALTQSIASAAVPAGRILRRILACQSSVMMTTKGWMATHSDWRANERPAPQLVVAIGPLDTLVMSNDGRAGDALFTRNSVILPVGQRCGLAIAGGLVMGVAGSYGFAWAEAHHIHARLSLLLSVAGPGLVAGAVFLLLYLGIVICPTIGCADYAVRITPPHGQASLMNGAGIRLARRITTLSLLPTILYLVLAPQACRERRYPGLQAARQWRDQNLQHVLYADSLARYLLGVEHWQGAGPETFEANKFSLTTALIRVYFGHLLIAISVVMLSLPLFALCLSRADLEWFYPVEVAAGVLWWASFSYSALVPVKRELDTIRRLRNSTVRCMPSVELHREFVRTLSQVLHHALNHVLPEALMLSSAIILIAFLAEIHAVH